MYFLIKYLLKWLRGRRAPAGDSDRTAGRAPADDSGPAPAGDPGRAAARTAAARPPVTETGPSAAARGPLALLAHQVGYDLRTSLRNPRARFFTFFFPLVLLVVFNGVFGSGTTVVDGVSVRLKVFYVPGILAMSIVVASYANLVISLSTLRESGILKRRRATPVPPALLIAGQALSTAVVVAVMATILLVIARVAYGIGMAPAALAAVAVTAVVGTITFACIGYAVSGLISPDAAQPLVQATMLPLWFISGVFIPIHNLSPALRKLGDVFPVAHLANSLHLASVHSSFTSAISGTDMLVLAAWAVAATGFAAVRFSWLPSTATA